MDAFPSSGQQGLLEEGWAQGLRPCSHRKNPISRSREKMHRWSWAGRMLESRAGCTGETLEELSCRFRGWGTI